jgi:hypothetical protein
MRIDAEFVSGEYCLSPEWFTVMWAVIVLLLTWLAVRSAFPSVGANSW